MIIPIADASNLATFGTVNAHKMPNLAASGTLKSHKVANSAISGSSADPPEVKKLKKAATDFEAMLMAKWWSAMKQGGLQGEEDSNPGHDTLDDMGIQAMSTAVASRGGLGIGAMLVRSLLSNAEDAAPATPNAASVGEND